MRTRSRPLYRRTALAGLVSTILFSVSLAIMTPGAAHASVWNCSSGFGSAGAWAYCRNGDSANFQVVVVCQNVVTLSSRYQYGPARPVGGSQPSTTSCQWYERFSGQPWAKGA